MHVPEGWSEEKIADIAEIQVGRDLNESAYSEFKTDQHRFPVFSNTVENRGLYGFYNFEEYSGNSVTIVGRGIGLGTAFARKKGFGFGAIGRLLIVSPINNSFNVDFFANYANFRLRIFNESGGIPQLPGSQLAKYHIVLPPILEQQKIAQILSTWDKAIEKLEALIAAKQKRKKALMQQLLTGRKRFAGFEEEWKVVELGKLFKEVKEKVGTETVVPHSITAGTGFVSHEEKWGKDISGSQYENYTLLKKGQFSYNKGNSKKYACGCMYLLKHTDEIAVSNVFISFERHKDNVCNGFYEQYFMADYCARELRRYITSGARSDGLLNLSKSDFFSVKLPLPTFKEQQKIASVLSTADREIQTHQKQLSALKEQKKGLMQQLLTGKKRVKVDSHV